MLILKLTISCIYIYIYIYMNACEFVRVYINKIKLSCDETIQKIILHFTNKRNVFCK
jgi:hypothetical protein